jgi:hypothetical protein
MDQNQPQGVSPSQRIHEVAFSVNLAFALVALFFLLGPQSATSTLFRMNVAVYRYLHLLPDVRVPKDYYTGGYFAFFLPATALAICVWALLRVLSRSELAHGLLRSVAGITALAASPAWWVWSTYLVGRRDGWSPFAAIQFYELALVLLCATLYLFGKWGVPTWISIIILLLHNGFWFWQFGSAPFFMGYGGPVAPTVSLCAVTTWVLYLQRSRHFHGIT